MRGTRKTLLVALTALAALVVVATGAHAQAFGRVTINVVDEDGKPLADAKVTATCAEVERFHEEKTTNKKGRAPFTFTDATKVYTFRVEHDAYPPVDLQVKPEIRTTTTREVTMTKAGAVPAPQAPAGDTTTVVYSPAERVYNDGVRALQEGDMATGKMKILEALERDPDMALALSAIAGIYLQENNFAEAVAATEKLIERDPQNTRALRMLYEAHAGLGNDKEAEAALKELSKLEKGGDILSLVYNEGLEAAKVGDLATARKRFEEVLKLEPTVEQQALALHGLLLVHMNEKEYQQAATVAEQLLAIQPGHPQAIRARFDAYRGLGDEAKAKEAMAALAELDPTVLIKQFMDQGIEKFNNGDAAGAAAFFEQVLEIDPDHARAHYRLGVSQVSAGNMASAKEHLNRFIKLAPEDPEAPAAKDMLSYLD